MIFFRTQVYLGSDLWVQVSLSEYKTLLTCWDLTDVTLADEDTNSILMDNANRAFQGNVAIQPDGQLWKQMQCLDFFFRFWISFQFFSLTRRKLRKISTAWMGGWGEDKWSKFNAKLVQRQEKVVVTVGGGPKTPPLVENTICNLNKYILQFRQIHRTSGSSDAISRWRNRKGREHQSHDGKSRDFCWFWFLWWPNQLKDN